MYYLVFFVDVFQNTVFLLSEVFLRFLLPPNPAALLPELPGLTVAKSSAALESWDMGCSHSSVPE